MNRSTLTLQPSGRQYLLKKLEQDELSAELRNDIIKHLEACLEATVKTKRYDLFHVKTGVSSNQKSHWLINMNLVVASCRVPRLVLLCRLLCKPSRIDQ